MNIFLICPVRDNPGYGKHFVEKLELLGHKVHFPPRDTNQDDSTGLRICKDNLLAIKNADVVAFVWDGKSQGSLFDLGMAFALGKTLIVLQVPEVEPNKKSFQAMSLAWAEEDLLNK